jgi:predicted nucleic acid-binding protein
MVRKKDRPGAKDIEDTPSAGERVVLDANLVIDLLLAELSTPTTRAEAARRVLAICCVACFSDRLWGEVIQNCHKRGIPMLRGEALGLRARLEKREKLIHFKASQIEATSLSKDVARNTPHEDHHVVQLAHAAGARWIFTADDHLRERASRFRMTPPLRVEAPEWVLAEIAEPASPCTGDRASG